MPETVLIEQTSKQDEGDAYTSLYVRLSIVSDSDVSLNVFEPTGIVVEEAFGKPFVDCKVSFIDTLGSLTNDKILEGDYLFKLLIGKSPEDFQTYDLKLRSYSGANRNQGESANYETEIHLVSSFWQTMCHDKPVKGWRNKKYSDAIKEIVESCGIENYTVSDTKRSQDTIIQPYWTNHEMIQWMAERSHGVNGSTFFTYGAMANGMFFYCSFDDMIDGIIPNMYEFQSIEPRNLVLGGDPFTGDENKYRRLKDLKIVSNYSQKMSSGASGVDYGYYDYDTREYVTGTKTYTNSDERQLSDWAYMSESQETIGSFYFGGRDSRKTEDIASHKVSKAVNGLMDVITSTEGLSDIQIGEKVNVKIPVNPEQFEVMFNEAFSGNYIVSRKRSVYNLKNNTADTVFRITRQGVNGTTVDTLVQSKVGKKVNG